MDLPPEVHVMIAEKLLPVTVVEYTKDPSAKDDVLKLGYSSKYWCRIVAPVLKGASERYQQQAAENIRVALGQLKGLVSSICTNPFETFEPTS